MEYKKNDFEIIENFFQELIMNRNSSNEILKNLLSNGDFTFPKITNKNYTELEWLAIPGMYGGFRYMLKKTNNKPFLIVFSMCRVSDGFEQFHEITTDGIVLTAKGSRECIEMYKKLGWY